MVIWITGLSGSGKTTIAKKIYKKIKANYNNCILLDGDIIREALNYSWGYSLDERLKGAKQIHGLCKILDNEEAIVICATMSLFSEIHKLNRKRFKQYIEIFLDVDIETLIKRDKNNLYSKALQGLEKEVVGITLPYDKPNNADLILKNNTNIELEKNIHIITNYLQQNYKLKIKE